ncbi:MAG: DUF1015 family protein [Haloechinothrix sp.]
MNRLRPTRAFVVGPPLAGELATLDSALFGSGAGSLDQVRRDAARLRRLADDASLTRTPSTVVYRLSSGGHQQTGVVVEVPLEDYRSGRVRRHEATRPERERQLGELLDAAEIELVPVTLAHLPRPRLRSLLAEVAGGEPAVHLVSEDGLQQTVWIEHAAELTQAVQAELDDLQELYIADGHHRMAAADRFAALRHRDDQDRASDFGLGALFPIDELRVFAYHRCISPPAGVPASRLLEALAAQPATERLEKCTTAEVAKTAAGVVSVRLDGHWYRLRLRTIRNSADARSSLDVVALEEGILAPLLGVAAIGSDPRVNLLPGTLDSAAVARWCDDHQAIGFLLHPPSMEQVMAVADAGEVMPPKSTWFDPKARAGPFLRDLLR